MLKSSNKDLRREHGFGCMNDHRTHHDHRCTSFGCQLTCLMGWDTLVWVLGSLVEANALMPTSLKDLIKFNRLSTSQPPNPQCCYHHHKPTFSCKCMFDKLKGHVRHLPLGCQHLPTPFNVLRRC